MVHPKRVIRIPAKNNTTDVPPSGISRVIDIKANEPIKIKGNKDPHPSWEGRFSQDYVAPTGPPAYPPDFIPEKWWYDSHGVKHGPGYDE